MVLQKFSRNERLHHKIAIQKVFKEGEGFYSYPLRFLWRVSSAMEGEQVRVLVTVPARNFRKAVHRNFLKRRMREAYRKNKEKLASLVSQGAAPIDLVMIYTAKELCNYHEIEKGVVAGIQYLAGHLNIHTE